MIWVAALPGGQFVTDRGLDLIMERKTSLLSTGLAVAAVVGVLLAGYFGAYWWRLPDAYPDQASAKTWEPGTVNLDFPSEVETFLFTPAVWIHQRTHWKGFDLRAASAHVVCGGG